MEIILTYLWKSSVIVILFYGFYKILLQKETHFRSNRYFLFSGIFASLTIPFIVIPKYIQIEPIQSTIVSSSNIPSTILTEQIIEWSSIFFYGYLLVTTVLFIKFMLQILSIANLIRRSRIKKIDKLYLVQTTIDASPFSFFNFIVFNPDQFNESELDLVLHHEKVHAMQRHSLDTIFVNFLSIIQWFNPFVWLYKKDITENLEFIADDKAQKSSNTKNSYQQLLLKTTIPNYQLALANNFYNSLLKKRIIMLHKQRSNSNAQWKYALMIPILLAFVFTFNTKTIAQKKKAKVFKQKVEVFAMGFTKESTQEDLDKIIKVFSEKGLNVKFNNVKRNSDKEITAIKIDAKAKSGKASAAYASDLKDGINPIQITFDNENNNLSIGSSSDRGHAYSNKRHKVMRHKGEGNSFVFVSDNDDDNESTTKVWVSKDGDTTKMITKKMIIDIDEEHTGDAKHKFIIKEGHKGDELKTEVIKIKGGKGKKGQHFIFTSDDDDENTTTTYIVNGKKMTKEEFKKFDKDKIKTIEIKKEKVKKKE